uniref:Putative conserved secreted protein n=1 Tax=Anopheles triannulatus TaxID=58253 RepID=A0A2M4AC54_9DIPT
MFKLSVTLLFIGLSLLVVCDGSPAAARSSESNESNEVDEFLTEMREMCKNNTGSDEAFPNFMQSVEQGMMCAMSFDVDNFVTDLEKLTNATRTTFFSNYCPKLRTVSSCKDGILTGMKPCLEADDFKIVEALAGIIPDAVELICKNDGSIIFQMEDETRLECIGSKVDELTVCATSVASTWNDDSDISELTPDQCSGLINFRQCIKEKLDSCQMSEVLGIYDLFHNALFRMTPCLNSTVVPQVELIDNNAIVEV